MSEQLIISDSKVQDARRTRAKGLFPRLPLSEVLELARKIFELGHGEDLRRLYVIDQLKRSPNSSSTRTLIVSSNSGYGLTTGAYNADYLGLTDRGKTIVDPVDEFSKYQAIYDALFSNEIFAAFVNKLIGKPIPNDEVAIDNLRRHNNLSEDDAKAFWDIIKENIFDFSLVQEYSGKKILISREEALEKLEKNIPKKEIKAEKILSGIIPESPSQPLPTGSTYAKSENEIRFGKMSPEFHFNIQIHLPENASADVYDAIFKSIATNLLGRDKE